MEDINIKALETIEKAGKGAAIGEIRVWGGKRYHKTPKGWRPVPKGYKEGKGNYTEEEKETKRSELARQLEELDEKLFEHEKRRGDYDRQADWARDKKEMQDKFDKLQAEHRKLMGRGWGMRS